LAPRGVFFDEIEESEGGETYMLLGKRERCVQEGEGRMKFRTFLTLVGIALLLLGPRAAWCFTEDQTVTIDMGWFQLKKLDISQFNLLEVQLGGVKLGDTIYNYLGHRDGHQWWTGVAKYYGNPAGLVVGGSVAQPSVAAPMAPMPTGAPMGYGAGYGTMPPTGGAGMAAPGAAGVSSALAFQPAGEEQAMPGGPGMGAGMAPGGYGAAATVAGPRPGAAAVTAQGQAAGPEGLLANDEEPYPYWALPVWFALQPDEVEYIYHKTPDLVIGVVVNKDGIITAVAVAGAPTSFAKTSLGRVHRYVRLGDLFKMALYRYGYPNKVQTFNASTAPGQAVTFQETVNQFDNDCILWYDEETDTGLRKNIAFTCHDMKVTRIHIWIPQEGE
jgi:hypothetical protein